MSDDMTIADYLAEGGVLTSPANVPPRYRAELLKLMAIFVDSELAGAAGFADKINDAPGIKERIAAARIVLEKTDHAERVLKVMGEFGVDEDRYANSHPWTARLERDAPAGSERGEHDMRLSVFNYPLESWADAVTMNLLMGLAVGVQMRDFLKVSYGPLAEAFRQIAPVEQHHAELAREGLEKMVAEGRAVEIEASLYYWWPRVEATFGSGTPEKMERLRAWGLRRADGESQRRAWEDQGRDVLGELGLKAP